MLGQIKISKIVAPKTEEIMKKVLIIGAGAQGGPCASILAGKSGVTEIRLGDINLDVAKRVAEKINSRVVQPLKLDAGNRDDVVDAAQGVDVIINLTLLKFNDTIMEGALASNVHYVDTACTTTFLEGWAAGKTPKYHHEFINSGKSALVGCGFSPGISNVLTRYICEQMDRVERIMIRVGRGNGKSSDDVVSEWKPTWSPEILLEDYSEPPMVLQDGNYTQIPIFCNPETFAFPEPIGDLLISSHMHEEPYLIPKIYIDKGLKEFDFKYPVDKLVGGFIKMGFAADEAIELNGLKVVPRDVLMKLVKRPGNKFLEENKSTIHQSDLTGIINISVEGEQGGEKISHIVNYRFTDGPNKVRQAQLFRLYGTTMIHVALPAVIGAKMCVSGEVDKGVISPDSINPKIFFHGMAARGVPFEMDEITIKKTLVKSEK
jgi:saccharopine dehydrogenase (NAD+, L-lysine-forming)